MIAGRDINMKYKSKSGSVYDTNIMGLLIDRCDNCNKVEFGKKLMDNDMLCNNCYWNEEIMECETCGREISTADYNDFHGECMYCNGFYDAINSIRGE